jgi:hypothetical protein
VIHLLGAMLLLLALIWATMFMRLWGDDMPAREAALGALVAAPLVLAAAVVIGAIAGAAVHLIGLAFP